MKIERLTGFNILRVSSEGETDLLLVKLSGGKTF